MYIKFDTLHGVVLSMTRQEADACSVSGMNSPYANLQSVLGINNLVMTTKYLEHFIIPDYWLHPKI